MGNFNKTFGVCVFLRNNLFLSRRSLQSLLAQTYRNWKIFLIGDRYPQQEFKSLISLFKDIIYFNCPIAYEEKYKDDDLKRMTSFTIHKVGLELMRENDIEYCAFLDDDDIWFPHHLESIAYAYQYFPHCCFIYTQSINDGHLFPNAPVQLHYENYPPVSCRFLHSSASWNLKKIPLTYLDVVENKSWYPTTEDDLWERIRNYCYKNNLSTLYLPTLTVKRDNCQIIPYL